jgi:hypothetical protein
MDHGSTRRRCLCTLMACCFLSLTAATDALAGEWENMRGSSDSKLRAHAKRIAEIEARERGVPTDQQKGTDKITKDRIAEIRGYKSLADTPEKAFRDAKALVAMFRGQSEYLDIVTCEWGVEGAERRKLREAIATLQKSYGRANANLARATAEAEATNRRVQHSGTLEAVARIEAATREAGERLRTRWQHAQAALEREREQRAREAAERARGVP